jgi:ubiquinol-cytochrome c reductase cytochrome b subunit
LLMAFALLIYFVMPFWSVDSIVFFPSRCRFIYRKLYWFFISNFFLLGWLGGHPVEEPFSSLTTYCTAFYFLFFLIIVPIIEIFEQNFYLSLQKKKFNK